MTRLLHCFTSWNVKPATYDELIKSQVIIALAFGFRINSPGSSNLALTRITEQWHEDLKIPIIAQHEIADQLYEPPLLNIKEHRTAGKYLDTFEVIDQAFVACRSCGFQDALIVAHPDHQWRSMQTAQALGLRVAAADVSSVPYDGKSVQWWTKNAGLFMPREILSRLIYLKEGKI